MSTNTPIPDLETTSSTTTPTRRPRIFPHILTPPPDAPTNPTPRLSQPAHTRIRSAIFLSTTLGATLGVLHGGQTAALRFRAENSHRQPTSQEGWYLYHKTKNYAVLLGAGREGFKMGVKLGVWTGLFFATEEAVDGLRWRWAPAVERMSGGMVRGRDWEDQRSGLRVSALAERDAASSVLAGMAVAGAFSVWNRLDLATGARMTKLGFLVGLGYGLAQDGFALVYGRRLAYVDWVKRLAGGASKDEDGAAT